MMGEVGLCRCVVQPSEDWQRLLVKRLPFCWTVTYMYLVPNIDLQQVVETLQTDSNVVLF